MKHIYFISGYAADDRVFANIDFCKNEAHFIAWKIPGKKETIASYAKRMSEEIHHPNPILIGFSFGGMMSIEIAKIIQVEKIILISSVKTFHELPLYIRVAAKLRLNKIFPIRPYRFLEFFENYNLGAETKEEKKLMRNYRDTINLQYNDWAVEQILHWKNDWYRQNLVHIHGTKDRMLPIKYVKPDYIIQNGGHLMIMNRAEDVNEILKKEL